jgi:hypothetical protein
MGPLLDTILRYAGIDELRASGMTRTARAARASRAKAALSREEAAVVGLLERRLLKTA